MPRTCAYSRTSSARSADRRGHVQLVGDRRRITFRIGLREELGVDAEDVEGVAVRPRLLEAIRGRARDRHGLEPPDEQADVRKIEMPRRTLRAPPADVRGMRRAIERRVDERQRRRRRADRSSRRDPRADDRALAFRPAGGGTPRRAPASPRRPAPAARAATRRLCGAGTDRVARPRAAESRMRFRPRSSVEPSAVSPASRLVSDQITDVRDDPVLTGLDEPVLVELRDVVFDDLHLLADDAAGDRAAGCPASISRCR